MMKFILGLIEKYSSKLNVWAWNKDGINVTDKTDIDNVRYSLKHKSFFKDKLKKLLTH